MPAVFVAVDIATFWSQAWVIFRGAPFNLALLVIGLAIAATFYVAASIIFPRVSPDGDETLDLDNHFWAQRRTVFTCVMIANLIVAVVLIPLALLDEGFGRVAQSPRLWLGLIFFVGMTATAAFAPNRRAAAGALILLVLYHVRNVWMAVAALIAARGWSLPAA